MTEPKITPVILSGGSGTRLWPMSRPERPKQMLSLTAEQTMLQLTALRAKDPTLFAQPIIVANGLHADMIEAQLATIDVAAAILLLEPTARNTAPAIALAALTADPGAPLLVMPSDHVILDTQAFHDAIARALPLVADNWLVTFGIMPDAPDTGYGYMRLGEDIVAGAHQVAQFLEKPNEERAVQMLAAGGHVWNAGIFLFRADAFLDALSVFQPEMLAACRVAIQRAQTTGSRIYPDAEAFAASPSDSIDYAVMEKAEKVACVPVDMGWSDVGSWDSLYAISDKTSEGNAVRGAVHIFESNNCLVHSDGPNVSLIDVEDLIVVVSGNDILILPRGHSQHVRKAADHAKGR